MGLIGMFCLLCQYHPRFSVAHQMGNFDNWIGSSMDGFHILASSGHMFTNDELMICLGPFGCILFQCNQVHALVLHQLSKQYNVFRPLTELKLLSVSPKVFRGLISKVY